MARLAIHRLAGKLFQQVFCRTFSLTARPLPSLACHSTRARGANGFLCTRTRSEAKCRIGVYQHRSWLRSDLRARRNSVQLLTCRESVAQDGKKTGPKSGTKNVTQNGGGSDDVVSSRLLAQLIMLLTRFYCNVSRVADQDKKYI